MGIAAFFKSLKTTVPYCHCRVTTTGVAVFQFMASVVAGTQTLNSVGLSPRKVFFIRAQWGESEL